MAPSTVHLLRHAQDFHNLNTANQAMRDPLLTKLGLSQCRSVERTFPNASPPDLIVASPLKRTIYTALHSFKDVIASKNLRVLALPEVQEISDLPCDTGSSVEELWREFADKPVDLSLVEAAGPGWNSKRGPWNPSNDAVSKRAEAAREWLASRPEQNIVVITHGGYLHFLTEHWDGHDRFVGTGWANCEFRGYNVATDEETGKPVLEETVASRSRRRGAEKPLTEAEQRNLRKTALTSWGESGFSMNDEPMV